MKQTRLVKILAAGFACAAGLGIALAQTTTTTTTTDPVTGTTTTQQTTTSSAGTIVTYTPGFGLLHVPDNAGGGASPLLLYSGHHRGRSCGSHRQFVGHSTRYAGNHLLHESRRQGARAQSRVEPTTTPDYQARGNNYYDNDKTLTEKSLRLNQRRPREISRALCCTHVAACDGWSGR